MLFNRWKTQLNYIIARVPTHVQKKFQDFFITFQDPKSFFQNTVYCSLLVNLLYTASSTANTLDQVHCIQRCNIHMHYIWNDTYFEIYCHFVAVSKNPNLALCTLVNFNQDFAGSYTLISSTNLIFQDFPSHGNFVGK